MYICDIPNNLLINDIFNINVNKTSINTNTNDSFIYFKNKKKIIFDNELNNLSEDEQDLWKENHFTFQHLHKIVKFDLESCNNELISEEIEITNDDLLLIEVISDLELGKYFLLKNKLIICNFSKCNFFQNSLYKTFRFSSDIIESYEFNKESINFLFENNNTNNISIDLFYTDVVELNLADNFRERNYLLLLFTKYMCIYQNKGGIAIFKITDLDNDIFLQEFIYLLSGWYYEILIVKPSITNFLENTCFLICKNFYLSTSYKSNYLPQINSFLINYHSSLEFPWNSFLKQEFSLIYIDRLKELRMIFGQIYMELLEYYLTLLKNKNRDEKLITQGINNNIKCENWIEKYLPH